MNGKRHRAKTFVILAILIGFATAIYLWFTYTIYICGFVAGGAFALRGRRGRLGR